MQPYFENSAGQEKSVRFVLSTNNGNRTSMFDRLTLGVEIVPQRFTDEGKRIAVSNRAD